ncbi:MAG: hypothetical protein HY694_16160 [Deltaproteobacteria bacterium]|nr:hypothetical protein [Deltaproteobacteria bacterium]
MGRIILVTGGNRRSFENYSPRSLAYLEPTPSSPFWLDLLSPSERFLHRLSIPLKFHPQALRACSSRHRKPGCEDFGHYLFIKASLLEPSKKNMFIQYDMKVFLSSEYLITIHERRGPLLRLLPAVQELGFDHTGSLLLAIFDESICRLIKSLSSEGDCEDVPTCKEGLLNKNPLWWRLRNFRAALLRQVNLVHELAFVGARFFNPDDRSTFGSIRAKICFLSDMITGLLSRMDPSLNVIFEQGEERTS